jgi:DNA-binding PadR family transcriptional regulator
VSREIKRDGLVTGRQVVQRDRPNKRVFSVTTAGIEELERLRGPLDEEKRPDLTPVQPAG